jgi:hypothetical protein
MVFIVVFIGFSFSHLALRDFSSLSCHFWPFTEVLRKILGSLTREVWKFLKTRAFAEPPSLSFGAPGATARQAADFADVTD